MKNDIGNLTVAPHTPILKRELGSPNGSRGTNRYINSICESKMGRWASARSVIALTPFCKRTASAAVVPGS